MNPQFASHYSRALAAERVGRYEEAVLAYQEAIRVNPVAVEAHVHLGLILRELGRDEEANHAFLKALDLQRDTGRPLRPRARPRKTPLGVGS